VKIRLRRNGLVLAFVLGCLLAGDVRAEQPECPQHIPLYRLIPYGWPCPIGVPRCYTDHGVCRWPLIVPAPHLGTIDAYSHVLPGQPCRCVAANGAAVPGVIR
jgi:hypothetical protein